MSEQTESPESASSKAPDGFSDFVCSYYKPLASRMDPAALSAFTENMWKGQDWQKRYNASLPASSAAGDQKEDGGASGQDPSDAGKSTNATGTSGQ